MIVAVAESLKKESPNRVFAEQRVKEFLDVEIVYGKHSMASGPLNSASREDRLTDLHDAFNDKSIDMIICAKGGYNTNDLLRDINWELIKSNPKPIMGMSDVTVLVNAINAMTGLVTILGPNFIDFSEKKGFDYSLEYFGKVLQMDEYTLEPSSEWSDDNFYKDQDNRNFIKNSGPIAIQSGVASGKLVGGNLCSLNLLQGTPYMPVFKEVVLCLEDDDLVGEAFFGEFNRNFESLLQAVDLSEIKAILVGRNQIRSNMDIEKMKYIFLNKGLSKDIPIVINLDFGHTKPYFSIPIGGTTKVIAENNKIEISIKK